MLKTLLLATLGVVGFGAAVLVSEAAIYASLRQPGRFLLPEAAARTLYLRHVRNVVQADTACARYDPVVTYVLRHGACTFENVEFSTTLRGNSAGLRDTEDALLAPRLIVLGDSYAMGWGVEEGDTFVRRLAATIGVHTLNAGLSSYGTAREMLLMERLDTSVLETLLIQYHPNDAPENRALLEGGGHLPATPESLWREYVDRYQRHIRPLPGKRLAAALYYTLATLRSDDLVRQHLGEDLSLSLDEEVDVLSRALAASSAPPEGVEVVLFELNDYGWRRPAFAVSLRDRLSASDMPEWVRRVRVLDVEAQLSGDLWFPLDGHLTAEGHLAVAEVLAREVWPGLW